MTEHKINLTGEALIIGFFLLGAQECNGCNLEDIERDRQQHELHMMRRQHEHEMKLRTCPSRYEQGKPE
jgi:hypothetical protein